MLLTSAGLTAVSLLIVQRIVERQVRSNLRVDLANSVETFRNFQKEREGALARSAALMANLPVLKALMTSRHPPTIQDASAICSGSPAAICLLWWTTEITLSVFTPASPGVTAEQAQVLRQENRHRGAAVVVCGRSSL